MELVRDIEGETVLDATELLERLSRVVEPWFCEPFPTRQR